MTSLNSVLNGGRQTAWALRSAAGLGGVPKMCARAGQQLGYAAARKLRYHMRILTIEDLELYAKYAMNFSGRGESSQRTRALRIFVLAGERMIGDSNSLTRGMGHVIVQADDYLPKKDASRPALGALAKRWLGQFDKADRPSDDIVAMVRDVVKPKQGPSGVA